jgi:tight adherence protein B
VTALAAGLAAALGVLAAWEGLAALEGVRVGPVVERILAPVARAGREGRAPTALERRRLAVLGAATLFAAGWLLGGVVLGLAAALAGPWAAAMVVRARRRRWRAHVARAAPAVAVALADAIEAGHAVAGAVGEAARGVAGPARAELRIAADAIALGEPTAAALERLRARAGGGPFDAIVAALLLQRDAGGPLASLLRGLGDSLAESVRLADDARAATAQARFTAVLVAVLPLGAAGLAELGHPGYLAGLLGSPLTAWLGGCAVLLQVASFVAVRRIARVRA